ncbi:hypothetical protein [Shewanella frigidimarina]|jgi:hypothetical protein|uniref:hypothetical protein n=1 Tax=Shewanella frigidimarina TaxID=56812 RepID=UPI003F9EC6F0
MKKRSIHNKLFTLLVSTLFISNASAISCEYFNTLDKPKQQEVIQTYWTLSEIKFKNLYTQESLTKGAKLAAGITFDVSMSCMDPDRSAIEVVESWFKTYVHFK